jgi:hypothetical protein
MAAAAARSGLGSLRAHQNSNNIRQVWTTAQCCGSFAFLESAEPMSAANALAEGTEEIDA